MFDEQCFNISINFDNYCEHYSSYTNELWLQLRKQNDNDKVTLINKTVEVLIKEEQDTCGKMPVYIGIAMMFVFLPYIRMYSLCLQFQVDKTSNASVLQRM